MAGDGCIRSVTCCRSLPNGPFLALPDGHLLTVDSEALAISMDDGLTWRDPLPAAHGQQQREPGSYYLLRTASGVLVMVYLLLVDYNFSWDDQAGEPGADCRLEIWVRAQS